MLSATITLTGSLLASGIGSDFLNGVNLPSCKYKQLMRYYLSETIHMKRRKIIANMLRKPRYLQSNPSTKRRSGQAESVPSKISWNYHPESG
jgi:hypothetical protein